MRHLSDKPKSEAYAGAYVAYAPGEIVGAYANGDTERTEALWDFLRENISERGMDGAYDRERKLLPILLDMERNGIPVDLPKLDSDVARYTEVMNKLNAWIIKRLRCSADINLDSGAKLVDALIAAKVVDLKKLGVTPKSGKPKTDKSSLDAAVSDRQLSAVLRYRSQLKTCLSTFMENWLTTAKRSNGYIYTYFHQVRGSDANGTKTGRLSSTPNFQNLANEFQPLFAHEVEEDKGLPVAPFELPSLPLIRGYIIPPEDYVLIDKDFSSQEPRILAHFEDGPMLEQYHNDPWIDFHDMVRVSLKENYGLDYPRKLVKAVNLGVIYGQGASSLALKHDVDISVTKELKQSILYLYPGIAELYKTMKFRARIDAPFKTWGGREYKCEPPKYVDGKLRTFDYKMVNCLIQGSAADCTKEAIIRFYALTEKQRLRKNNSWFLYLNVHDELVAAVPKEDIHEGHALMKQAMESVEFSLPILTEGTYSFSNWGEMKTYDKKGVVIYNASQCIR